MNNFDKVIDRKNTNCEKYDGVIKKFGVDDIIPMWVADMDFKTPSFITKNIIARASHPIYGYPTPSVNHKKLIINWQKRHGFEVKKEWITFSPNIITSLNLCVLAFSNKRDKIILQSPIYPPFFSCIESNGRIIIDNRLILKDKYEIDFNNLESQIDSNTKLFLLCNPHNPTGRVFTKEELIKLGEICLKNNILIISDEIHSDIVYNDYRHIPIASISKEFADITITLNSPSKSFNIAGLNHSYLIISNEVLLKKFQKLIHKIHFSPNIFGLIGLESAYENGEEYIKELNNYLETNINFVNEFLKQNLPKIKIIKPEATYLLWLDFREYKLNQDEIKDLLLKEVKVGFNSGSEFGEDNAFFRMNIATQKEKIKKVLKKMEEVFNKIN